MGPSRTELNEPQLSADSAPAQLGDERTGISPDGMTLMLSWGVAPALVGSASIVEKLAAQMGRDRVIVVGEGCPSSAEYRRRPELPRLHYAYTPPNFLGRRTIRNLMMPLIHRRIDRIARSQPLARVIGVFPDEFWMWSGFRVARKLGIPFYPFLHNTYVENRKGWAQTLARVVQKKVFDRSRVVFVANDGMKEFYQRNYPGLNVVTLDHINEEAIPEFEPPPTPSQRLKVAYLGSFNKSNADAFVRFVKLAQAMEDVEFTTFSKDAAEYFAQRGLSGPNFNHTRVPYHLAVATLRQYDVMFLPHGFCGPLSDVEYNTIFPTRTIPYLLTGRPILAHSPPSSFLNRWLRQHDCALIVDEPRPEDLSAGLTRLRQDAELRARIVRNGLNAARQFSAPDVMQRFWSAIGHAEKTGPVHFRAERGNV
jgi:hypothetical protein